MILHLIGDLSKLSLTAFSLSKLRTSGWKTDYIKKVLYKYSTLVCFIFPLSSQSPGQLSNGNSPKI